MPPRGKLPLLLVALVLALVALWPDGPARDDDAPRLSSVEATQQALEASPDHGHTTLPASTATDRIGAAGLPRPGTSWVQSTRKPDGTRVRLHVHAPSTVKVGEVFEARVDFEAYGDLRELVFAISYEKSRLALVGWSEGDFSQPGGLPAELEADEPSDGNIQVNLRVDPGRSVAGAGSMAVFRFEAIKAGISGIVLQNVTAIDRTEAVNPIGAVLHDGSVSIH